MIPLATPSIDEREHEAVTRVLSSGQIACGEEVQTFQREFADFCGADHAVAVSNGTTALHAALHGFGIGPGDRVITTPLSFVATANSVRLVGADPVFVDVDLDTYALDPHEVEAALHAYDDVAAILAVHLYGHPAPMDHLADLAEEHDVPLIEDAAQAHGAAVDGRRVGSLGDAACFSFYPTKNMTTGEGGMVTTGRADVAERVARFVDHGRAEGGHVEVGHNFRLTDLAAAIGRVQLTKLPDFNAARRENAHALTEAFAGTDVVTPTEASWAHHVYHQYTVRSENREALAAHFEASGVGTGVYYPRAIHQERAYEHVTDSFPKAERAAREVLSLPVHPELTDDDRRTIIDTIHNYVKPAA